MLLLLAALAASAVFQVDWYPPGSGALPNLTIYTTDSVSFVWLNGTQNVSTPLLQRDLQCATLNHAALARSGFLALELNPR
jgi:hypothetical protein